jgi:hypothetical protein
MLKTTKKQQVLNSLARGTRLKPNYLKAHYTICKIYKKLAIRKMQQ